MSECLASLRRIVTVERTPGELRSPKIGRSVLEGEGASTALSQSRVSFPLPTRSDLCQCCIGGTFFSLPVSMLPVVGSSSLVT
jgi:hypothetical protein